MRRPARMPIGQGPAASGAPDAGEVLPLLRAGFLAFVALVLLSSCALVPVAVEGLPTRGEPAAQEDGNPWVFVPVGAWITRDTVTPVSVGMCDGAACPMPVAVAVVEARGAEAQRLALTLNRPSDLAGRLAEGNRRRIALVAAANRTVAAEIAARRLPRKVAVSTRALRHRRFSGFSLAMHRQEDGGRAAHAAVLGRQRGRALRVVVVVGPNAAQVESAARAAAEANL